MRLYVYRDDRLGQKIKPTQELVDRMLNGDFQRVDGDTQCKICQKKIYDHSEIECYLTFIVDCRGKIVKV